MRNSHVTVNDHLYSQVKFLDKCSKKNEKMNKTSLSSICRHLSAKSQ